MYTDQREKVAYIRIPPTRKFRPRELQQYISRLGTLENSQKSDWKSYINPLVFACNCTPHDSTRVSPYELMFGRSPRLPIDTMFQNAKKQNSSTRTTRKYINELKESMERTREIVEQHTDKAKDKQKKQYDKTI